jgi:OmpA-OmpF porin, OOP family
MTIAPGLAETVEAKAISALQQIGLLSSGTASLADKVYSLTGIAASAAAFETMAGTRDSTDDFTIGELAIAPPAVSPFLWGVAKRDAVLTLSGYAPSAAAKASVLALTTAAAGRVRIVDEMKVASGLAEGIDFPALVAFALGQVARLDEASAELRDTRFLLTGRAADFETATAVRQAISGLGSPLRGEADIALPPAELPAPVDIPDLAPELVAEPPVVLPVPDKATDTAQPVAAPAPVPAKPVVWPDCTSVITTALEGDRILFDYWKAEQRTEHVAVLDRLAAGLRRCNPATRVEVAGHTDIRNLSLSNQRLSEDRAGMIREALISRGIGGEMLVLKGYAAERPVVPNDSEANMALNRRVEFTVLVGP